MGNDPAEADMGVVSGSNGSCFIFKLKEQRFNRNPEPVTKEGLSRPLLLPYIFYDPRNI